VTEVRETRLPGVGVRHDFETGAGRRIGVIVHHSGHRDLLVYDDADDDRCRENLRIDEAEAHALAEMLGATRVASSVDDIRQNIEGLAIDWLPIREAGVANGATIGDLDLRQRTGVTIVAVLRDGTTHPSPGPEQRLLAGDTAVVVGLPDQIAQASDVFAGT
jgi:TrkA domain protein